MEEAKPYKYENISIFLPDVSHSKENVLHSDFIPKSLLKLIYILFDTFPIFC